LKGLIESKKEIYSFVVLRIKYTFAVHFGKEIRVLLTV